MSSSNRIIKKTDIKKTEEKVYVDENYHGEEKVFLGETFELRKKQMEKELQEWKAIRTEEVYAEMEELEQQGYLKGKETAYAEIFEQVQAENEKKMREDYDKKVAQAQEIYEIANKMLKRTEEEMFHTKRKWIEQNEEELAEVIRLTTEKIVGKVVTVESEEIAKMMKEALSKSETKNKNVWVRVNPKTKKMIEEKGLSEERVELLPDATLQINDFVIETDSEWIDATIENKLLTFKKKIMEWVEKNEIFE